MYAVRTKLCQEQIGKPDNGFGEASTLEDPRDRSCQTARGSSPSRAWSVLNRENALKPDIASLAGLFGAIALILLGQHLEGGHIGSILQPTAALIVFGGTLGATMLSFPLDVTIGCGKALLSVFMNKQEDLPSLIRELIEFATISRKDGLLALQKPLQEVHDPFLKKALQLVIDGTQEKALREMLEVEIETTEHTHENYAKYLEACGGYAPTVGILGAVLGLIHVMENLSDPSALGGGIATAFVATVYGVGSANLLFLPAAGKLKIMKDEHGKMMTIIVEAIVAIQQGENPTQLKERLKGYLTPAQKVKVV